MANEVIRVFGVTVSSCIMPTEEMIPDQTVHASRLSVVIDVSDYFTIAELGYSGATTTYTARTEAAGVVSDGISGSMLTLTKVATSSSSATVVVRASVTKSGESSPGCMAEQRFDVRVKTPPRANDQNPVRDTTMFVGDPPIFIHLAPHFIEDDADRLTYYGVPYREDVVWATIMGGQRDSLRIKLVPGLVLTESISDTISVGASDPEDFVYQRLVVQVFPANRAPVVDTPLPDTTLAPGGRSIDITLSDHFSDPNGDVLTFTERVSTIATTREADVVTAEIASGALEITPAAAGTATVTVTATDPGGLFVRDDFLVVVTSNRKPVVSSLLRDTTLASGGYTTVLALSAHFSDPDKDKLTYTASSSAPDTAAVAISGGTLTVTTGAVTAAATATITVRASDPDGLSASDAFVVSVNPNVAPSVDDSIVDTTMASGGATAAFTLADHFTDPDGKDADLTYTSASSSTGTATASISLIGSMLTVTTGSTTGTATITVTAQDPGGLSVQDAFVVSLKAIAVVVVLPGTNRPPERVGTMPKRLFTQNGQAAVFDVSGYFSDPDDDKLTYSARTSSGGGVGPRVPNIVTVSVSGSVLTVTPSEPGVRSVNVTADDNRGGTVPQKFVAMVSAPPVASGTVAAQTLTVGGSSVTLDMSGYFTDADDAVANLAYALTPLPSDAAVSASLSGSSLTLTPVSDGSSTVTVTASDAAGGSALQSVTVVVGLNRAPTCNAMAAQSLTVQDAAVTVVLSCSDQDNDPLTYTLSSVATDAPASITLSGHTLTISPRSVGAMSASVTVSDGRGSTTPAVNVTVRNLPPETEGSISDVTMNVGAAGSSFSAATYFRDPETETLTYAASSSNSDVAQASLPTNSNTLTLTPGSPGSAMISVTAQDPHNAISSAQTFTVTVVNKPPTKVGSIEDRTVQLGGASDAFDVSEYFNDPEGQALTYAASSPSSSVLGTAVSGSTLTLTGKAAGAVEVSVTATDPHEATSVPQSFTVTVCGAPTVLLPIQDQTILMGSFATVPLGSRFSDPNGGNLSFSARRTSGVLVSTSIASGVLRLTPEVTGSAIITVTAGNDCGGSTEHSFGVTVRGAPVASGKIPTQTLTIGGSSVSLDVAWYFSEPDGDAVSYSVGLVYGGERIPNIVSASLSGSTLTLVPLGTAGNITVKVTATDTDGSAVQSIRVRVNGAS